MCGYSYSGGSVTMNELVQVLTDFGLLFLFIVVLCIIINYVGGKI